MCSGNPAQTDQIVALMRGWNAKGIKIEVSTPAQSAAAQLKAIDELIMEKTGSFLKETGEEWAYVVMNIGVSKINSPRLRREFRSVS